MIYVYKDMLKIYGSPYQIERAIKSGLAFKIARGLYSNERHPNPSAVVCVAHPRAVLTMDSAFYLHGLTDCVPQTVSVATPRNTTRINNALVKQYFMEPRLMKLGVESAELDGSPVRVFSRERMLVELLRNSNVLPLDYYKELIGSYRKIVSRLDMREVEDCIALYARSDRLFTMLQREVL